jgi:hypothetical protein
LNARPHAAINRSDSYRVDITIADLNSFEIVCEYPKVFYRLGLSTTDTWSGFPCAPRDTFDPANIPATRQIVTTYMLAFLNTVFGREDDSGMLTADYAAQKQPNVEFFASEACSASLPSADYFTYLSHPGQCEVAEKDPATYFVTDSTVPGFQIQDQGYVVSGAWAGYAWPVGVTSSASDAGTTTITPADFSGVAAGATELCIQGSVGADYSSAALLGMNVNQARVEADGGSQPGADGGFPSTQTVAIGGSGITVQYTNPGGSPLRVQIQTQPEATDPTTRWCANLSGLGGTETIPWSVFWGGVGDNTLGCWNSGGINPPAGTAISAVVLVVPGDIAAAVPYDICLQGIAQAP